MSAVLAVSICNLVAGLVCVGLAVPLIRGKVKPNAIYGARTARTLGNESTWYRVNAACGRWLLWLGVAVAASGAAGWLLAPLAPAGWWLAALTVCAFLPVLVVVPVLLDRDGRSARGESDR